MNLGWTFPEKSFQKLRSVCNRIKQPFMSCACLMIDGFLWWLLGQQKAICKHIRLVHVSEFSYMKRNPRRRHDVDSCHFTKFIHTNSLWHRDGYDISCHQTCSNPSLCWALLHRSPVCLNTRICATAMNSSICHCETSGMLMSLHKTCYWRHLPLMPSPKLH